MLIGACESPNRQDPGDEIEVRCHCGQRDTWTRHHSHPTGAARAVTRGCPSCGSHRTVGAVFYDAAGRPLG